MWILEPGVVQTVQGFCFLVPGCFMNLLTPPNPNLGGLRSTAALPSLKPGNIKLSRVMSVSFENRYLQSKKESSSTIKPSTLAPKATISLTPINPCFKIEPHPAASHWFTCATRAWCASPSASQCRKRAHSGGLIIPKGSKVPIWYKVWFL